MEFVMALRVAKTFFLFTMHLLNSFHLSEKHWAIASWSLICFLNTTFELDWGEAVALVIHGILYDITVELSALIFRPRSHIPLRRFSSSHHTRPNFLSSSYLWTLDAPSAIQMAWWWPVIQPLAKLSVPTIWSMVPWNFWRHMFFSQWGLTFHSNHKS